MNKLRKIVHNKAGMRSALMLLLATASVSVAAAHETDDAAQYTMTVISDTAYGGRVIKGDYEKAIEKITSSRRPGDRFSTATNLCVAYTKSGDIENAQEACGVALALIEGRQLELSKSRLDDYYEQRLLRVHLALALSNRGVLHVINGDTESARNDFEAALELRAGVSAPAENLARLDREA